MFEQLKQQYLASFEFKIKDLNSALENQDPQALIVLVHQLAGSSGSYGLDAIAELCSEIESMLSDQSEIDFPIQQKTQQLMNLMQQQVKVFG